MGHTADSVEEHNGVRIKLKGCINGHTLVLLIGNAVDRIEVSINGLVRGRVKWRIEVWTGGILYISASIRMLTPRLLSDITGSCSIFIGFTLLRP